MLKNVASYARISPPTFKIMSTPLHDILQGANVTTGGIRVVCGLWDMGLFPTANTQLCPQLATWMGLYISLYSQNKSVIRNISQHGEFKFEV